MSTRVWGKLRAKRTLSSEAGCRGAPGKETGRQSGLSVSDVRSTGLRRARRRKLRLGPGCLGLCLCLQLVVFQKLHEAPIKHFSNGKLRRVRPGVVCVEPGLGLTSLATRGTSNHFASGAVLGQPGDGAMLGVQTWRRLSMAAGRAADPLVCKSWFSMWC